MAEAAAEVGLRVVAWENQRDFAKRHAAHATHAALRDDMFETYRRRNGGTPVEVTDEHRAISALYAAAVLVRVDATAPSEAGDADATRARAWYEAMWPAPRP